MAVGAELRRRRLEAGLTQARLGGSLSKAFVSSVEHGRVMPSLPALLLLADQLGLSLDTFFLGVNNQMTGPYTREHEHRQDMPPGRGR